MRIYRRTVKVSGTRVTLAGTVDSWYQKSEAGRIAWKAPGVWSVENNLVVEAEGCINEPKNSS
jgi:osmotically-inducible protein OsmY